jgi:cytochrome o ubiquinol oxidase subunit II
MLFKAILNMCVEPGKMCMSEMMAIDAKGGLGMAGINNTLPLTYDKHARRGAVFGAEPSYVVGVCSVDELEGEARKSIAAPRQMTPVKGVGLNPPDFTPARPAAKSSIAATRSAS